MNNLFGVYECTADEKGRVILPLPLKKQLGKDIKKGFVLKQNIFYKALELFPIATWDEVSKEVNALNRWNKKNADFIRQFNFGVIALEADSNARLLIPKNLLTHSGIKRDVIMAAAVDRIEIWDQKKYEKFIKDGSSTFEKLTEEVMGGFGSTIKDLKSK